MFKGRLYRAPVTKIANRLKSSLTMGDHGKTDQSSKFVGGRKKEIQFDICWGSGGSCGQCKMEIIPLVKLPSYYNHPGEEEQPAPTS